MIIAIDGPAASGKSTIAKKIAQDFNLVYLDTGAMYRIITFFCLENCSSELNEQEVVDCLANINIGFESNCFSLNSKIVGNEIRTPLIDATVSKIASFKQVREFAVDMQRQIASKYDSILDGRDIGTVVFKDADYKFYFEASPQTRAKRRYDQNKENNISVSYEEILKEIIKRDELDTTRIESPLVMAKDAILIDTSEMSVDQVVLEIKKNLEIR